MFCCDVLDLESIEYWPILAHQYQVTCGCSCRWSWKISSNEGSGIARFLCKIDDWLFMALCSCSVVACWARTKLKSCLRWRDTKLEAYKSCEDLSTMVLHLPLVARVKFSWKTFYHYSIFNHLFAIFSRCLLSLSSKISRLSASEIQDQTILTAIAPFWANCKTANSKRVEPVANLSFFETIWTNKGSIEAETSECENSMRGIRQNLGSVR